jgi:hypothetical protein
VLTEHVGLLVMLWTFIQEVPGLNLNQDMGYPDRLPQSLQAMIASVNRCC